MLPWLWRHFPPKKRKKNNKHTICWLDVYCHVAKFHIFWMIKTVEVLQTWSFLGYFVPTVTALLIYAYLLGVIFKTDCRLPLPLGQSAVPPGLCHSVHPSLRSWRSWKGIGDEEIDGNCMIIGKPIELYYWYINRWQLLDWHRLVLGNRYASRFNNHTS